MLPMPAKCSPERMQLQLMKHADSGNGGGSVSRGAFVRLLAGRGYQVERFGKRSDIRCHTSWERKRVLPVHSQFKESLAPPIEKQLRVG